MATRLQLLLERARAAQDEIEAEFARRREAIGGRIERGRLVFDAEVRARHRAARTKFLDYVRDIRPLVVLTAPVIYSLLLAIVILDVMVTLFQAICFPVYGIAKVRRRDHIVVDRQYLGYLNALEKLNCLYCGYANGVMSFAREVAGRTEAYWCPIKHSRRVAEPHRHYPGFMYYGDEEAFIARWAESRAALKDPAS